MPWLMTQFVQHPYQGVYWIHPLKQRRVEELIEYTKKNYPNVTHIVIFGSSTREDCHVRSDIDIAVFGANHRFCPPNNDRYDVLYGEDIVENSTLAHEVMDKGVCVYGEYVTE